MKINKIKINSFGNLNNKEFELKDGVNIIYGENESGKSTLLKFIINMFYGISKNKRGKNISDYDKFKPWNTDEFSGTIKYELDNKNNYEVFRDFNKKNPKIFNNNLEEISKQYSIDKNIGNLFFYEQTGLDESMFISTIASMQQEVRLDNNIQNNIIQKIANIMGTGDDSVSFKKTLEKLDKKQLEEIGTNRSVGRPINIINKELDNLNLNKKELLENKNLNNKINIEKNNLSEKLLKLENKNKIIKKIKINNEENKINNEKINFNKKIINENNEKINNLNIEKNKIIKIKDNLLDEEENKINNKKNRNKIILIILNIILLIFNIVFFINKNYFLLFLFLLLIIVNIVIGAIYNNKLNKKINKIKLKNNNLNNEKNNKINLINNEINILKNNINKFNNEINILNKKIIEENKINNENIILENKNNLTEIEIMEILENRNIEKLEEEIENQISNIKLNIYSIELQEKEINTKLEKLSEIEEQIQLLEERKEELNDQNDIINIAKEGLKNAYQTMKESISPKFTEALSKNVYEISNGKYKTVAISDEFGLIVQLDNGNYIPADRMSTGTIDQLYLSLRIALMDELSEENMPLILDETFAYFDDIRLKKILNYIYEKYNNKQIIIFTCTNREQEIINNLGKEYNYIQIKP